MPELRKDIVTREWVILAKERAKRPSDFPSIKRVSAIQKYNPECPFCPGNESLTAPEVLAYRNPESKPNTPGWKVRVIPNKFPALNRKGELNRKDFLIYDIMDGVGTHEVIIDTPDHIRSIHNIHLKEVEELILAYCDRYNTLRKDPRLKYILVFKNHGNEAGSSLTHSHSQVVATPFIPQKVWWKIKGVEQYKEYREKCVYCHIIEQEIATRERMIIENEGFIVCAPFASRSPFQIWIIPKTHKSCFAKMSKFEVTDFAKIFKETMSRLYLGLYDPPYNFTLITAPCDSDELDDFHWHLEIIPRLSTPAGFEMGTSIYINVVPPENAAKYLREVSIPEEQTVIK